MAMKDALKYLVGGNKMKTLIIILAIGIAISALTIFGAVKVSSDESRREEAQARRKAEK